MSESNITRARMQADGTMVQVFPDGSTRPLEDRTDWERVLSMTEEEIEANALSDPDNPPMTDEELARTRRDPDTKEIRRRLNLTQFQFADRFDLELARLRAWEAGTGKPDRVERALLRVIEKHPEIVFSAIWGEDRERRAG